MTKPQYCCEQNMSEKPKCDNSYYEGDKREEEEQAGNLGREESLSFALRQHLPLLKHQIDEGKQHAVYHRLQQNITTLKLLYNVWKLRPHLKKLLIYSAFTFQRRYWAATGAKHV